MSTTPTTFWGTSATLSITSSSPVAPGPAAEAGDQLPGRAGRRPAVQWRRGVVLDLELDLARPVVAGQPAGELQGQVDAGRPPGGGRELSVEDVALVADL